MTRKKPPPIYRSDSVCQTSNGGRMSAITETLGKSKVTRAAIISEPPFRHRRWDFDPKGRCRPTDETAAFLFHFRILLLSLGPDSQVAPL